MGDRRARSRAAIRTPVPDAHGSNGVPAQLPASPPTRQQAGFAPDVTNPRIRAKRRALSAFSPDTLIGNYRPTRTEVDGSPISVDGDYRGTFSRNSALDASRIRATAQAESDAIALSDTLITRNGVAHYDRSHSPNVVRYPDGDVSPRATVEVAQARARRRASRRKTPKGG